MKVINEQVGTTPVGDLKEHPRELDPRYCDVIVQRWEELTGGKAKRAKRKAK